MVIEVDTAPGARVGAAITEIHLGPITLGANSHFWMALFAPCKPPR